ncbi:MAG: hypothetical protein AAF909_12485 [Pseudomonadota bacterium]
MPSSRFSQRRIPRRWGESPFSEDSLDGAAALERKTSDGFAAQNGSQDDAQDDAPEKIAHRSEISPTAQSIFRRAVGVPGDSLAPRSDAAFPDVSLDPAAEEAPQTQKDQNGAAPTA